MGRGPENRSVPGHVHCRTPVERMELRKPLGTGSLSYCARCPMRPVQLESTPVAGMNDDDKS